MRQRIQLVSGDPLPLSTRSRPHLSLHVCVSAHLVFLHSPSIPLSCVVSRVSTCCVSSRDGECLSLRSTTGRTFSVAQANRLRGKSRHSEDAGWSQHDAIYDLSLIAPTQYDGDNCSDIDTTRIGSRHDSRESTKWQKKSIIRV